VAGIKRRLLQCATDIEHLLLNAKEAKDAERKQDLQYAREYTVFARERLGDTEYLFTDAPMKPKKGKLKRRKIQTKGKLNRRTI
jgi:hypothetical protein